MSSSRNYMNWADSEVNALVEALVQLSVDPSWKTDGGFKNGFMNEICKLIKLKIPSFDKQPQPHIESKIKFLRRKFNTISEMCKQSGCQWNYDEHIIACEWDWFEAWRVVHKEARCLWNYRFPYFKDLETVWGKDRATGANVETFDDAVNNKGNEVPMVDFTLSSSSGGDDIGCSLMQDTIDVSSQSQTSKKRKTPIASTEIGKRKKTTPSQPSLEERFDETSRKFGNVLDAMNVSFAALANAATNEDRRAQIVMDRMKEVWKVLIDLGLNSGDVSDAARAICKDPMDVELLLSAPENMRRTFVNRFLP